MKSEFTPEECAIGAKLWARTVELGNGTPHRVGLSVFGQAAGIYAATLRMPREEFLALMGEIFDQACKGPP